MKRKMEHFALWLSQTPFAHYEIELASADASFREYYRLKKPGADKSYLLMDASHEKEALKPFVDVTKRLLHVKLKAPQIYLEDLEKGYLVIEDFGATHYLDLLDESNFETLYKTAIAAIVTMQQADSRNLPLYDREFLHFEMDLMQEWYLKKHLNITPNRYEEAMIEATLRAISDVVLSQPQDLFVHRDYHSRNIMHLGDGTLGVIDYQDAMSGAVTYDLVSLLKDCYITFDREKIEALALHFRDLKGLHVSDATFLKWFDFMGLQRHIKVLGIFSRLYHRDGKAGYLNDIPLTLHYVLETASRYEQTQELAKYLKTVS